MLKTVGPVHHLGSILEMSLMVLAQMSSPKGIEVGELAVPLVGCGIGWTSRDRIGDLAPVMWVVKSW